MTQIELDRLADLLAYFSGTSGASALRQARGTIAIPNRWVKRVLARRSGDGRPVAPTDPKACAWCAIGALAKVLPDLGASAEEIALRRNLEPAIIALNDSRTTTHAQIVCAYDLAIGRLEMSQFRGSAA